MTAIAVQPFVLKDVDLLIGTDNYEAHASSVQFVPTVATVTWQGLTPAASFSDSSSPTWTCTLEYAQDWKTPNSLSEYLLENTGTTVTCVFKPSKAAGAGQPIFTADLIIVPGAIGGAVNTVQVASVTLGVDGAPALTRTV